MKYNITEIESFVKNTLDKNNVKSSFIPGETLIPPSGKLIGYEEVKNMVLASFDGWLTTGRFNKEFQEKLSEFLKVKSKDVIGVSRTPIKGEISYKELTKRFLNSSYVTSTLLYKFCKISNLAFVPS